MALISCGECGKGISDKASKCPHCGAGKLDAIGMESWRISFRKAVGWLLVILGLLFFAVRIAGFGDTSTPDLFFSFMIGLGVYLIKRKVKNNG